jgi:hypothetical protein
MKIYDTTQPRRGGGGGDADKKLDTYLTLTPVKSVLNRAQSA